MKINQNIRTYRQKASMTQEHLAEKLGVTRQAVSRWENEETQPGIDLVEKLARMFAITTDELLGCDSRFCQSCGTFLLDENSRGTEADGSKSALFCAYCEKDGQFSVESVEEVTELNVQSLQGWLETIGHPCYPDLIRSYYLENLPKLERWESLQKTAESQK